MDQFHSHLGRTQVALAAARQLGEIIEGAGDMDTLVSRHEEFVERLADRALLPITVCGRLAWWRGKASNRRHGERYHARVKLQGKYEHTISVLDKMLRSVMSFTRMWGSIDEARGNTRSLLELRNKASVCILTLLHP
jgi:hypothetical protein